jgi:hypothetical protein
LLDANLLVLLVVGGASTSFIGKHKRLRAFTVEDYRLLVGILRSASPLILTPNTVTEASNLSRQIAEPARSRVMLVLRSLIRDVAEVYTKSREAVEHAAFPAIGITDAVLLNEFHRDATLLTVDHDLYQRALRSGRRAINFNHHIQAGRV